MEVSSNSVRLALGHLTVEVERRKLMSLLEESRNVELRVKVRILARLLLWPLFYTVY